MREPLDWEQGSGLGLGFELRAGTLKLCVPVTRTGGRTFAPWVSRAHRPEIADE